MPMAARRRRVSLLDIQFALEKRQERARRAQSSNDAFARLVDYLAGQVDSEEITVDEFMQYAAEFKRSADDPAAVAAEIQEACQTTAERILRSQGKKIKLSEILEK